MTRDEIDEVLRKLLTMNVLRGPTDLSEPAHVTEFSAYRGEAKVTIRILDYGPKDSRPALTRYACRATAEYPDGVVREAVGNHGYTITEAITNVHWNNLDR